MLQLLPRTSEESDHMTLSSIQREKKHKSRKIRFKVLTKRTINCLREILREIILSERFAMNLLKSFRSQVFHLVHGKKFNRISRALRVC
jgi:serine/threonine-protein kinase RIO1